MKCKYCGCTDGQACVGGCSWVAKNVCSSCVLPSIKLKGVFNAYASDPNVESIELVITEYPQNTHKKKTEQRFLILK